MKLLSAEATAALLILSVKEYGEEKSKRVSRALFTRKTLLGLSNRKNLHETFLSAVKDATAELGWAIFEVEDGFAMLAVSSARNWTQISASRVKDRKRDFLSDALSLEELQDLVADDDEDATEE